MTVVLKCENLLQREQAHPYLAQALALPDYYGQNLDALYDCLTDLADHTVILEGAELLREDGGYGAKILNTLEDAARDNPGLCLEYRERAAHPMRRKDREVTDIDKITSVFDTCKTCRLGFNDGGEVYIVPLNFGYERTGDGFTLYFHGAKAGRKYELLRQNPRVGFEMDCDYELKTADMACGHSARFLSIIGNGTATIIEDPEEKRRGLDCIMAHATGHADWEFPEARLGAVGVFKVTVDSFACKEHE